MTVRSFVQMLLEKCDDLDGLIDVHVCAQVKDMIPRIEDADNHPDHWCVDDNLDITEIEECWEYAIEDIGKNYHIHVNQIEY